MFARLEYYPYLWQQETSLGTLFIKLIVNQLTPKTMYSKTKKNAFLAMFALTFLSVPTFAQTFNTLGIGIASPVSLGKRGRSLL